MKNEKKNLSKKRILLIVTIVVAIFVVLQILGKPFLFPFNSRVMFDAPMGANFNDDTSIVIDQAGARMLFLDNNRKLKSFINLGDDTEINSVTMFTDDGEHYYLAGRKLEKNSNTASSFRIVRMDHNGKNPTTIMEYANEDGIETNVPLDITSYDGCLYVVRYDYMVQSIIVTKYQIESGQTEDILSTPDIDVFFAKYNPKEELLYLNDYHGRLFTVSSENPEPVQLLKDYMVENFLQTDSGDLIWVDSINKNLYKNDELLLEDSGAYFALYQYEDNIIFDNTSDDRLSIYNLKSGNVSTMYSVDFSTTYFLFSLGCTLCIFYLGLMLVLLIIRTIRNTYRAKNQGRLIKTGMVVLLIATAFIISFLYTYRLIDMEKQNIEKEIRFYSHYFAESMDPQLLDDATYTPDIGNDPTAWQKYLEASSELENKYGFFRSGIDDPLANASLSIYKKVGDKLSVIYDSDAMSPIGYQFYYSELEQLIESEEIVRYSKLGYDNYRGMVPITDSDGEIIGVVEYAKSFRLTNENIKTTCIDMIVKLLSIFATIYIVLIELLEFFKNKAKRKELIEKEAHPHPEIAMIRTAMFLFCLVELIDSVVIVFVAKHLLQVSGIKETSFLLALPSLMVGVGLVVTCLIFDLIAPRVYVKRIAVIAGVAYIIVRIVICYAVISGNFFLFCLMKLCSDLSWAYMYCIVQTMRVKATNENERYHALRKYSLGRFAGIMLATLISGFSVQNIDKSVILYAVSAVLAIPLILLLVWILPNKTIYVLPSNKKNSINIRKKLSFLTDKSILVFFIFALIPMYLILGYPGYLFPLYSDTIQMTTMYVTTAVVMARAVVFSLSDSFEKLANKIDPWKIVIFSIGLIGIAFLEFAINSSIIWAMIMLVIAGTAEMVVMPATEMLWARQATARGIPLESVSASMAMIDEVICALKETMLSVFVFLGNVGACIALGIFCIVAILIFMFYTRKKIMGMEHNWT